VTAAECGLATVPEAVVELGPGSSQGVGLAALLSGSRSYTSIDVVDFGVEQRNIALLDELVELFHRRADIPGPDEYPEIQPPLASYRFPAPWLTDERLDASLAQDRVESLRAAVTHRAVGSPPGGIEIRHHVVRSYRDRLPSIAADMILSQAVLMYVPDLAEAYQAMFGWLRPGGWMSHQISYMSFDTAREWNGHWGYSDGLWKLLAGRQAYVINRHPHSAHVGLMRRAGFRIAREILKAGGPGMERGRLAARFRGLSDEDLSTCGAFVVASKP
jgi:hypothetical protein